MITTYTLILIWVLVPLVFLLERIDVSSYQGFFRKVFRLENEKQYTKKRTSFSLMRLILTLLILTFCVLFIDYYPFPEKEIIQVRFFAILFSFYFYIMLEQLNSMILRRYLESGEKSEKKLVKGKVEYSLDFFLVSSVLRVMVIFIFLSTLLIFIYSEFLFGCVMGISLIVIMRIIRFYYI